MLRKKRFTKAKNVLSCFKMSTAWWKAPETPLIYSCVNVDVSRALAWMRSYRERTGEKVTIAHLCTKALAMTLEKYPQTNAKIEGSSVYVRKTVDIVLMVSMDSGDLSGIKVNDADRKTLPALAREIREGAEAVRENRGPSFQASKDIMELCSIFFAKAIMKVANVLVNRFNVDLSLLGFPDDPFGSAVITSVSKHGIESAYAPFIPVGRFGLALVVPEIKEKPWVEDGRLVVRPVLKLCFTFDHRIFHGYYVSLVEKEMKRLLMNPEALVGEKLPAEAEDRVSVLGKGRDGRYPEQEEESLVACAR